MKQKKFESICKNMLVDMPAFKCKGWLLYKEPVVHLLRGFCCEDSSFDKNLFTIWAFVTPLYVPTDSIDFNFGVRLSDEKGAEKWWNTNDSQFIFDLKQTIINQGMHLINKIDNISNFIKYVYMSGKNKYGIRNQEALAYSLILHGDYEQGVIELKQLSISLDQKVDWQYEMKLRADQLSQLLATDYKSALQLLLSWENYTINKLKLQ